MLSNAGLFKSFAAVGLAEAQQCNVQVREGAVHGGVMHAAVSSAEVRQPAFWLNLTKTLQVTALLDVSTGELISVEAVAELSLEQLRHEFDDQANSDMHYDLAHVFDD